MPLHKSITPDRLMEAIVRRNRTLDNPGFCIDCGEESNSCEPDAREYECDDCGKRKVYGAEEIAFMGVF